MSWYGDITKKVVRRVPELDGEKELIRDLVEDAYIEIMKHSKADRYDKSWDSVLVRCVAMLYRNIGVEGSVSRSANGVSDVYGDTDIIANFVVSNIPQYIRPVGYVYNTERMEFPD